MYLNELKQFVMLGQAVLDGKPLEYLAGDGRWSSDGYTFSFTGDPFKWRVKPKHPKKLWIGVFRLYDEHDNYLGLSTSNPQESSSDIVRDFGDRDGFCLFSLCPSDYYED